MVQFVVFTLVLAIVYALKAAAVWRGHEALAEKSASFSWASMRPQDEARAIAWATEEAAPVSEPRASLGTAPVRRVSLV